MTSDILRQLPAIVLAILFGAAGGWIAALFHLPMPFLLGAFGVSIALSLSRISVFGITPGLPMGLRNIFVAVIGVMIGTAFSPDLLSEVTQLWLPALGIILFVGLALASNFLIFRKFGGFDRITAFYAAMPGGLIESVTMGEKAGADVDRLTMQQFLRIALVITFVPILLQVWTGSPVGSAAGMRLEVAGADSGFTDYLILFLCGISGFYIGKFIRLPAAILTGPLILSAAAHGSGVTEASLPDTLIALSQVIVGAGLGARFQNFGLRQLAGSAGLALLSVAVMLGFGAVFALVLRLLTDLEGIVLFIAFAPGGVTETALIALSLNASPVIVTTLHVFRIVFTVLLIALASWRLKDRGAGKARS